jgi:hypothetical protein
MKRPAKLQRSYQIFPLRKLETTKKRGVTRLYTMSRGGFFRAKNAAGENPASFGTDWTVKSARRSGVRKRPPYPASGFPACSEKIDVGMSTAAPVLGNLVPAPTDRLGGRHHRRKGQAQGDERKAQSHDVLPASRSMMSKDLRSDGLPYCATTPGGFLWRPTKKNSAPTEVGPLVIQVTLSKYRLANFNREPVLEAKGAIGT